MTFQPVLPPVMLAVISVMLIALRFISMGQLYSSKGARWATVWRWCGLTLAVLLLLIAAWRPGVEADGQDATASAPSGENVNVFFVVDRSPDSRMDSIRADIDALVDRYPRARFAMIAFASRASLDWPLSEDVWSLEPVIAALTPYTATDAAENDAAAAANILRYQLIAAGQQYRDSSNLVFYFGSGAGGSNAPQGDFEPVAGTVDGGAVFGYGTPAGNTPGYDEERLRLIATQLDIPYFPRQDGGPLPQTDPNSVAAQPPTSAATAPAGVHRTELYWFFTLLAAAAAVVRALLDHPRVPPHTHGTSERGIVMAANPHTPSRLKLRRRLLVFSAPAVIAMLLVAVKMISVVVAGNTAESHFASGDVSGLRADVSTLRIVNVIEPDKTLFAAGSLSVLEGRLDQADAQFSEVLSRTQSCAARVNLELVRERQGDLEAWEGRPDQARERYRSALALVEDAPGGCFAGNTDPDAERRAIRNDAAARLAAKMANLTAAPPPLSPPPPPSAPPPPPPPAFAPPTPEPDEPESLRLQPETATRSNVCNSYSKTPPASRWTFPSSTRRIGRRRTAICRCR